MSTAFKSSLTILFEAPFWIGLYERTDSGKYEVCKITFGSEPKDYEVYEFLLKNWHKLKFSPPIQAEVSIERKLNPKLYISQPDNGEQALEITETMVRSGAVDIVIVDSVAALVPKAEIDGDMGDSHVGLQARLMSQALRKLTAVISKSNCVVIFINQLREKVGVMFGNPETTTGGRALKFYSSIRMDVRRVETLKQGGEMVGNHTKVKVVKNKVAIINYTVKSPVGIFDNLVL